MFVKVQTSSYTEVTQERNPDDKWSADSTATSWTVNGVSLESQDGYNSLPAGDVKIGDVSNLLR